MAFQNDIDWLWNNFDNPQQIKCLAFVVEMGPPPILRGFTTGHDCVVSAIRAAREGKRPRALGWLKAGQCHNEDVQEELHKNANAAIDYALNTYGPAIP